MTKIFFDNNIFVVNSAHCRMIRNDEVKKVSLEFMEYEISIFTTLTRKKILIYFFQITRVFVFERRMPLSPIEMSSLSGY